MNIIYKLKKFLKFFNPKLKMNITRYNFSKNRSQIIASIRNSDIIAFDFEMSGVLSNNKLRNTNQDSVLNLLFSILFSRNIFDFPNPLLSFNLGTGKQKQTCKTSYLYKWEYVVLNYQRTNPRKIFFTNHSVT